MTNDESARISSLEIEVTRLGGTVARLDTEVSRLNDRMSSVEENVSRLDSRVARLEGEFSQMNERMRALERSMEHLSSRVDRLFWAIVGVGGGITVAMASLTISVWLQ